jgi:hypothetical protein
VAEQTSDDLSERDWRNHRSAMLIEEGGKTIRAAFVVGCAAYIAYLLSATIEAVAAQLVGKHTEASIVLSLLGELKVSVGIAWGFGVGGVLYGWRQNQARRRDIRRLSLRIQQLEAKIDPNRTSSRLTPDGATNPGDK